MIGRTPSAIVSILSAFLLFYLAGSFLIAPQPLITVAAEPTITAPCEVTAPTFEECRTTTIGERSGDRLETRPLRHVPATSTKGLAALLTFFTMLGLKLSKWKYKPKPADETPPPEEPIQAPVKDKPEPPDEPDQVA